MPREKSPAKIEKESLGQRLEWFLASNTATTREICDAFFELKGFKPQRAADLAKGKEPQKLTPQDISQYINRGGPPPALVEVLNERWPNWIHTEKPNKVDIRLSSKPRPNRLVFYEDMPLIAGITDVVMSDELRRVQTQGEEPRGTLRTPNFFGFKVPMQPVEDETYSPAFIPGDYIGLLPGVTPKADRLFAVEVSEGEIEYAAYVKEGGHPRWQPYVGKSVAFSERKIIAAVAVHLPQYEEGLDDAFSSSAGLKVGVHVVWPRPT